MTKKLVISVRENETLMGLFESDRLIEIGIDQSNIIKLEGNVYLGKVQNVIPSMQASFIDYGAEKDGFLSYDDTRGVWPKRPRRNQRIQDVLSKGQTMLVQIEKEAIHDKGCRLTTNISLPGRYIVLVPFSGRRGISRRLEDPKERDRLKKMVDDVVPKNFGVIVRTVSQGITKKEFLADYKYLARRWDEILKAQKQANDKPGLLHRELDMVQRLLRDNYSSEFSEIICDNRNMHNQVQSFMKTISPRGQWNKKTIIFDKPGSLVHEYDLDKEIRKALSPKPNLPSGGYLIIEEMETLSAIDVNTGRNIRGDNQRKTIANTNMEAAAEIPRQLRLRGIGGIVVIDFIDMDTKSDRNRVLSILRREIKKDKAASDVYEFSDIGLVQLTRERTRPSLVKTLTRECPHCEGSGHVSKIKLLRG
jgi:ribonuclease G